MLNVPLPSYWGYQDDKGSVETPGVVAGVVGTNTGLLRSSAPTITFAELPAPMQVSCNGAERYASLRIGNASLDIYPSCDAKCW